MSGTDSSTNVRITAAPNPLKMAWVVGSRNAATAGKREKAHHLPGNQRAPIPDTTLEE